MASVLRGINRIQWLAFPQSKVIIHDVRSDCATEAEIPGALYCYCVKHDEGGVAMASVGYEVRYPRHVWNISHNYPLNRTLPPIRNGTNLLQVTLHHSTTPSAASQALNHPLVPPSPVWQPILATYLMIFIIIAFGVTQDPVQKHEVHNGSLHFAG